MEAKIHKIIADVIKFRLDIRKTFQNELNVKAYENAVGKQKKQLKTYILFRFHKFFIMYRTLGDFAVEKPQKTPFHVFHFKTFAVRRSSTLIYIDLPCNCREPP